MTKKAERAARLRGHDWKRFLRGPDRQLLEELYAPALSRAVSYDRSCAYFSSSILSAAARGFGGLISNLLAAGAALPRPAVRLLVNEQLDPRDVDALLTSGDEKPLARKLLKQFKTPQNALERNRLQMLAWLAAAGWLEVRVGLMAQTRGIFHAKYGIVTDSSGDRLVFRGSGNETGEAIVENYEELEISTSWQDSESVDYFRRRFAELWADQDPNVRTVALPDAVLAKLIRLAPSDPPSEVSAALEEQKTAMLWHFLALSAYLPQGDQATDATALVDLWPHQRRVVHETASAFPAGRLLCDEVGMGKTIEAIAVLRRLLAGRGVARALLLVPAGLLKQWQEELREKGGLLVPYWDRGSLRTPADPPQRAEIGEALAQQNLLLLSREWARRDGNRDLLLAAPRWDLVLLDEAHAARRHAQEEREFNTANLLLHLLRELQLRRRTRAIILLSATPMQTQPWEPWDLLTTLGVGGRWAVEFRDIRAYYDGIALLLRNELQEQQAASIGRLVADDDDFPPAPLAISARSVPAIADALVFQVTAAPQREAVANWLRRGAPLGQRMHRNTRATLRRYYQMGLTDYQPPHRSLTDELYDYADPAERECYEAIQGYIDRRFDELEREKKGKGFVMTIYRRRAASSPLAFCRSLERRRDRLERAVKQYSFEWLRAEEEQINEQDTPEDEVAIDPGVPADPKVAAKELRDVQYLLQILDGLGNTDSKLALFHQVLRKTTDDGRAALVFTEYADTMEYLRDQLKPIYGASLGCYSGGGGQMWEEGRWQGVSKAEITERLTEGRLKVLVCTDAASEGLNLQAASALINYDLPWNPSRVEQRIGRIDRIGQSQRKLLISNLLLRDSVDMRVYQVLRERCGLFEHFVGPMQPVLSLAIGALQRILKPEEIEEELNRLRAAAEEAAADQLVTNTFIDAEALETPASQPPVTRQDFDMALTWLSQVKMKVKAYPERDAWRLAGLFPNSTTVTSCRERLERDEKALPITAGAELVAQIADKLPVPGSAPLVLGQHSQGSYRCVEARWVETDGYRTIRTAAELIELLAEWDGRAVPAAQKAHAHKDACEMARGRVQEMACQAREREEAGLHRQVAAARRRLLRELGRTLAALDQGNLKETFRQLVRRKESTDLYHRAMQRLGGEPSWSEEEVEDIRAFVMGATAKELKARRAGSEIEAALNDPRWKAQDSIFLSSSSPAHPSRKE